MNRLQNFLLDDVRTLLDVINNHPELADLPGGNFGTLQDFASYWAIHLENINDED